MKKLMSMGVVPLLAAALALNAASRGQERGVGDDSHDRFIGAWRLAWLEEPGPDGSIHRADCVGMFVFTRDGHASVQVMYRTPQAGTPAAPVQYAQGGYEATFGRYRVDPSARTFTYHVEGAIVRSLWQGPGAVFRARRQPVDREVVESRRAVARGLGALLKARTRVGAAA